MTRNTIGTLLIVFALIFVTLETIYFGSNLLPITKAEKACDTGAALVALFGTYLVLTKKNNPN